MARAVLREIGERTASLAAIELHPSAADLDEVRPRLRRALQHRLIDGGVVDDGLPLDDRAGVEPPTRLLAGRGDCLRTGAASCESLGRDHLDVDTGQQLDCLQGGCSRLEVDAAVAVVWGLAQPFDQPRGGRLDARLRSREQLLQLGQHRRIAGDLGCQRGAEQHVVGAAPARAIVHVDQLERQRPQAMLDRAVGFMQIGLGQAETQPRGHDGLAVASFTQPLERVGDRAERVDSFGIAAYLADCGDAVRGGECATDRTYRLGRCTAVVEHVGAPGVGSEQHPRQLIDERIEDRRGEMQLIATGRDHRRHRWSERRDDLLRIAAERNPLCQPDVVVERCERRDDATVADHVRSGCIHGCEPGDRRADLVTQVVELAERCKRRHVEALTHHLLFAGGQVQAGDAHGVATRGSGPAEGGADRTMQVPAIDTPAGLPRHHRAFEPRELQARVVAHQNKCTKGVYEPGRE